MTEAARAGRHTAWLEGLPAAIQELQRRWSLDLEPAWCSGGNGAAWVAPARRRDGTRVVLKIGMPHMEAAHEIEGLRFWDGDPTVRLLEADAGLHALLLERCEPGTPLRDLPETQQDVILAGLLRRLWRKPAGPRPFRPLSAMLESWAGETLAAQAQWSDPGLVRDGLKLLEELARPSPEDVLLATDLHAGNVLRAQRAYWLAIDPKPFVGDRAYDATQHLLNCQARVAADPMATIRRFAGLLGVGEERVRLWLFARVATEPGDDWGGEAAALARALA